MKLIAFGVIALAYASKVNDVGNSRNIMLDTDTVEGGHSEGDIQSLTCASEVHTRNVVKLSLTKDLLFDGGEFLGPTLLRWLAHDAEDFNNTLTITEVRPCLLSLKTCLDTRRAELFARYVGFGNHDAQQPEEEGGQAYPVNISGLDLQDCEADFAACVDARPVHTRTSSSGQVLPAGGFDYCLRSAPKKWGTIGTDHADPSQDAGLYDVARWVQMIKSRFAKKLKPILSEADRIMAGVVVYIEEIGGGPSVAMRWGRKTNEDCPRETNGWISFPGCESGKDADCQNRDAMHKHDSSGCVEKQYQLCDRAPESLQPNLNGEEYKAVTCATGVCMVCGSFRSLPAFNVKALGEANRARFSKLGFNTSEYVALLGAHTFGGLRSIAYSALRSPTDCPVDSCWGTNRMCKDTESPASCRTEPFCTDVSKNGTDLPLNYVSGDNSQVVFDTTPDTFDTDYFLRISNQAPDEDRWELVDGKYLPFRACRKMFQQYGAGPGNPHQDDRALSCRYSSGAGECKSPDELSLGKCSNGATVASSKAARSCDDRLCDTELDRCTHTPAGITMNIGPKLSVKSMKKAVQWHGQWQRLGQTVADYGLFADAESRSVVDSFVNEPGAFQRAFGAVIQKFGEYGMDSPHTCIPTACTVDQAGLTCEDSAKEVTVQLSFDNLDCQYDASLHACQLTQGVGARGVARCTNGANQQKTLVCCLDSPCTNRIPAAADLIR